MGCEEDLILVIHVLILQYSIHYKAAAHSMHLIFEDPEAEAAILDDASNTFNNLNCQSALINIRLSSLTFAKVIVNMYHENRFLFIDGETILFNEVATQRDPLAMAMYTTGITPLIRKLQ